MLIAATGDNHLGKGQDLGRQPGDRLAEQEQVWRSTLELARDRGCAAVLHAGDLFDGRRPEPNVMLAAERPLVEHRAAGGCPVLVIAGNHDIPSQDGPCGLDVLAEAGLILLSREPEARGFAGMGVACLPWTPLARPIAAHDGEADRGELAALAADLLLRSARELREFVAGPCLLLGHWSVSQTSLPNGLDVGQLGGVVLPMDDLQQLGFEALVFGHIHREQEVGSFLYVGSPQPLDFGEANDAHGVWLLDTDRLDAPEFVPLDSRGFVAWDLGDEEIDALADRGWLATVPLDGEFVKVRYRATEEQARRIDHDALRAQIEGLGAHRVWIEPTVERAHRDRGAELVEGQTMIEQLDAYLSAINVNGDVKPAMLERAERYLA